MEPGADAAFTVWAKFSDGTETDVTEKVQLTEIRACYDCDSPPILRVDGGGRVHAAAAGEAGLRAYYRQEPFEAADEHHRILVLPAGTFMLSGRISEANSGGIPVRPSVSLQVDSEAGRLDLYPTGSGEYRAYGVRGATRVTATSEYHHAVQQRLHVDGHTTLDLQMTPILVRPDEAAVVVLRAAPDCAPAGAAGALPEIARHRRYAAMLTTAKDERVFVQLTGGHFATFPREGGGTGGNGFVGQRAGGGFYFAIRGYYNDFESFTYPDILEQLNATQFLTFEGATTISGGSRLSGPFDGTISVYPGDLRPAGGRWWQPLQPAASCRSANHEFTLEER